jgi:hypothetical protein
VSDHPAFAGLICGEATNKEKSMMNRTVLRQKMHRVSRTSDADADSSGTANGNDRS